MRTKQPMCKKTPQILFSKNRYSPKVKVEHWEYNYLAEPKDNYVYQDHLGNMVSTYVRLGSRDYGTKDSESRAMLSQIFNKADPIYTFKPLVNFTSYPCTDTPMRNKLIAKANFPQLHPDYGKMDYVTTQQADYRSPYPCVFKPITMETPPWLLNRLIRSDLTQSGGTAPPPGKYTCMDTHTPIGHIRRMRLFRHQTINPATSLQDFPAPEVLDDINETSN